MKDKDQIEETRRCLVDLTTAYCSKDLNSEYASLCEKLIAKMARKRNVPFMSGNIQIWAASIVYAIGQINFLFDKGREPHATADDICGYFEVKKNTVSNKAREIREMFKLRNWDKDFGTEEMKARDPYKNLVMIDGFVVSRSLLPPELLEQLDD